MTSSNLYLFYLLAKLPPGNKHCVNSVNVVGPFPPDAVLNRVKMSNIPPRQTRDTCNISLVNTGRGIIGGGGGGRDQQVHVWISKAYLAQAFLGREVGLGVEKLFRNLIEGEAS